ncbi:MAG: L,D-transpeptidase [Polyangiaceae bacterium]|jgi:hypothetical protein
MRRGGAALGTALLLAATAIGAVRADVLIPPWVQQGDVDSPSWARSVVPATEDGGRPQDLALYVEPSRASARRGETWPGAPLPFYGSKRGSGCSGRFWLVGPLAWTCSDDARLSPDSPLFAPPVAGRDGLWLEYFFVRPEGASAYASLEAAAEGAEDRELEGGWAVGVVEAKTIADERWAQTREGLFIAMHDLVPARPSSFHGETIGDGSIDFAWVVADRAGVWSSPVPAKTPSGARGNSPSGARGRFERVTVHEESGPMVRIDDGMWMLARDLARPSIAPPPKEVEKAAERWIDIDIASQTLVAYEGSRPVYATLVSTGRGAAGSEGATPVGTHRIWVKLVASDMDNVEREDVEQHYSMQDVPYVQFFDGSVAIHGTYWHGDFGRVHSHGCVNLAPLDALWLFSFTEPRLPDGWAAAFPTPLDQEGSVVRVR